MADKPQNSEKISDNKEYFDRLRVLSGLPETKEEPVITEGKDNKKESDRKDKKEVINESIINISTLIKDSVIKGADGKNYGIVKENHKYFIKNATGKKDKIQLDESDFVYIGGETNRLFRRYHSLAEAQKQLNFLMKSLNENFNHTFTINERGQIEEKEIKETEVKEVAPGKDIKEQLGDNEEEDPEELSPEVQEPVAGEPEGEVGVEPAADVAPEPLGGDVGVEPSAGVPAEPVGDVGVEPVADAPEGGLDEPGLDEPEAELGGEEGLGDDDLGGLEEDPVELIQSLVGKLSQKVRMTELTPELTKSVLNSIISSLDLSEVDPEDRLVIAKKVKRGGVSKKEMELQEDFGDKVKGTQSMGKGKVTDIGSKSSIPQKKEGFGKTAKGTQSMGKGKLKAEGIDRIGQIVLEALKNHKKSISENKKINAPIKTTTIKRKPVSENVFTSNKEDLKSVEKLIEGIIKKKSLVQKNQI